MKLRPYFFVFGLILGAVLCGIAWRLHQETKTHNQTSSAFERRASSLIDETTQLQHRLAKTEARRLALTTVGSAPSKKDSTSSSSNKPNYLELLRTDPLVQSRFLAYQRSSATLKYQPLIKALGLTPQQVAKFEENLAQNEANQVDLRSAQTVKGLAYDDSAVNALRVQQQAEYDKAQMEVLGQAGFGQWKDYENTGFPREMVRGMAGAATVAGLTLTGEQVQQLTALVTEAIKSKSGPADIDWPQWDEQTRRFLTPEQVAFIQSVEVLGPLGYGGRYQYRLNNLITEADRADMAAARESRKP